MTIEDWLNPHLKKKMYENWKLEWKTKLSKVLEIKSQCKKWGSSTGKSRRENADYELTTSLPMDSF